MGTDLGIAMAEATILPYAPSINQEVFKGGFDISAHGWEFIKSFGGFPAINAENVNIPGVFSVIYPKKRKFWIDNRMDGLDTPYDFEGLKWSVTSETRGSKFIDKIIEQLTEKIEGEGGNPADTLNLFYNTLAPGNYPDDYAGPEWDNTALPDDVQEEANAPVVEALIDFFDWRDCTDECCNKTSGTPSPDGIGDVTDVGDVGAATTSAPTTLPPEEVLPIPSTDWIVQRTVKNSLIWGVVSTPLYNINQPFWVTIRRMGPPVDVDFPTTLVIQIGEYEVLGTKGPEFEVILSNNYVPQIVDYKYNITQPFEVDLSKIMTYDEFIELGFMTIAGRLIVYVNNIPLVYTRIKPDEDTASGSSTTGAATGTGSGTSTSAGSAGSTPASGSDPDSAPKENTPEEIILKTTPIGVFGVNIQVAINSCPMNFDPICVFAVPAPAYPKDINTFDVDFGADPGTSVTGGAAGAAGAAGAGAGTSGPTSTARGGSGSGSTSPSVYTGVTNEGIVRDSSATGRTREPEVHEIPGPPELGGIVYGIDFDGTGSLNTPVDGFGYHREGCAKFLIADPASDNARVASASKTLNIKQPKLLLGLRPADTNTGIDITPSSIAAAYAGGAAGTALSVPQIPVPHGATPYFFRLKGGAERFGDYEPPEGLSQPLIMSATENHDAPDFFHIKKSATVVLYGHHPVLAERQHAITLHWGWQPYEVDTLVPPIDLTKTFTGVIMSASLGKSKGMETTTLQCEDYMQILKSNPIVNSPFYDGMLAFYAIKDLAERAGIIEIVNDMLPDAKQYFLPLSYSFTEPAMRFPSTQMILECIMNIAKRFETVFYFDEDGRMHVKRLPGGLFSTLDSSTLPAAEFTVNADEENLILDKIDMGFDYLSTVSRISMLSVDRNTREILVYGIPARPDERHILYKKTALIDQPLAGSMKALKAWAKKIAERVFKPIRKVTFTVAGPTSFVQPLDFITVQGLPFRVTSVSRKFNAENNDLTTEYTCSWMGGGVAVGGIAGTTSPATTGGASSTSGTSGTGGLGLTPGTTGTP